MFKKIIATLLVVLVISFSVFSMANAMTETERQALIAQITQQIAVLQAQLNQMLASQNTATTTTNPNWCHSFDVNGANIKYGDMGTEVAAVQQAMQNQGLLLSSSNEIPGSYFGSNTTTAVINFQEKFRSEILTPNGLSRGTGTVARATKTKLNQLYGCATVVPSVPSVPSSSNSSNYINTNTLNNTCTRNWQCATPATCSPSGTGTATCYDFNYCDSNMANNTKTELVACSLNSSSSDSSSSVNSPSSTYAPPVCNPNWNCVLQNPSQLCNYTQIQKFTCTDLAGCQSSIIEDRPCVCQSFLNYGNWSNCVEQQDGSGLQTRTYTDESQCSSLTITPENTRVCIVPKVNITSSNSDGSLFPHCGITAINWTSQGINTRGGYCTLTVTSTGVNKGGGISGSYITGSECSNLTYNILGSAPVTYTATCNYTDDLGISQSISKNISINFWKQ